VKRIVMWVLVGLLVVVFLVPAYGRRRSRFYSRGHQFGALINSSYLMSAELGVICCYGQATLEQMHDRGDDPADLVFAREDKSERLSDYRQRRRDLSIGTLREKTRDMAASQRRDWCQGYSSAFGPGTGYNIPDPGDPWKPY
jgi:hypothetical protein